MKTVHGLTTVDFDLLVSSKYRAKAGDAKSRGIEFNLTFAQFRRMYTRTRCEYTGREMHLPKVEDGKQKPFNITIERIDSRIGYTVENCVAVCYAANNIKSVFECKNTALDVSDGIRMFQNIEKFLNK